MNILNKVKASFLYGKAIKRFNQKRYNDAANLLEKVNFLESENEQKELTYYYLGRAYSALRKNKEALNMFAKSYELFHGKFSKDINVNDVKTFIYLTNEYIHLLSKIGREKHAKNILLERNKLLKESGYDV